MSINSSIYEQIKKEYDNIRSESNRQLKKKKELIYTKIPRIKQIDSQLSLTAMKITKAIIYNPDKSLELVNKLEEENIKLIKEKKEILKREGYNENYLNNIYVCNNCKDTGYISNKMCKCMQQKLINKLYIQSNLNNIILHENFDNFDIRYFSDSFDKKEGISPRDNIYKITDICMNFIKDFDTMFSNLIFYGKPGSGKTFLCNCIAKEILDTGKTVLYFTAFQLFKMVEEERFNKNPDENIYNYLDMILSVDLLIIDDLGTEVNTIITTSELYNLINIRLLQQKSTIISTNLSPKNWVDAYSDRTASRIQGNYIALKFLGDDIRIKKKYKD